MSIQMPPFSSSSAAQTPWQDRLSAACSSLNLRTPTYQEYSDRRGGRTAWSCHVVVDSRQFAARNWYDGQYINGAREDAAEVALLHLEEQQEQQQQQQQQQAGTSDQQDNQQQDYSQTQEEQQRMSQRGWNQRA